MKTVMNDLIFEVTQEADGGFVAECLTEPIVTQGDSWDELRAAANEVVRGYFFDAPEKMPARIRLHLVRDESFALA
jgi:predicted RNase H-like HicB family nuclease